MNPGAHNATVRDCDFSYNLFGLWIEKANDATIENNNITGKRDYRSSQARQRHPALQHPARAHHRQHISFVRDAIYVDVSHDALFAATIACITAATAPTT
jgi:nitrous oxidase accessory protein